MPLLIQKKLFTGRLSPGLVDGMFKALTLLPQPEVILMQEANVAQEDIALCFQREMIYTDNINPLGPFNNKRYIGTKSVSSCIMAYIFNDVDNLFIHFDHTKLDLSVELKKFISLDNIKVILVGAGYGEELSQHNVEQVLSTLYEAAHNLKITIEIQSQQLLERNRFSNEDRFWYCFDKIILAAKILTKRYFNAEFDLARFSFTEKINAFKTPSANPNNINMDLVFFLPFISELFCINQKLCKSKIENLFNVAITNLETFYQQLDGIFSPDGFARIDALFSKCNGYPSWFLGNFAFDLTNKKIVQIQETLTSPNEHARFVSNHYQVSDKSRYFYAMDRVTNEYRKPEFKPDFLVKCLQVQSQVLARSILGDHFMASLGLSFDIDKLNDFFAFVATYNLPAKINYHDRLFKPSCLAEVDYIKDILATQTLRCLNEWLNKKFRLKMRKFPKHIVDALLQCKSPQETIAIKNTLTANSIHSVILDSSILCVPAVNISLVGNRISAAANASIVCDTAIGSTNSSLSQL